MFDNNKLLMLLLLSGEGGFGGDIDLPTLLILQNLLGEEGYNDNNWLLMLLLLGFFDNEDLDENENSIFGNLDSKTLLLLLSLFGDNFGDNNLLLLLLLLDFDGFSFDV